MKVTNQMVLVLNKLDLIPIHLVIGYKDPIGRSSFYPIKDLERTDRLMRINRTWFMIGLIGIVCGFVGLEYKQNLDKAAHGFIIVILGTLIGFTIDALWKAIKYSKNTDFVSNLESLVQMFKGYWRLMLGIDEAEMQEYVKSDLIYRAALVKYAEGLGDSSTSASAEMARTEFKTAHSTYSRFGLTNPDHGYYFRQTHGVTILDHDKDRIRDIKPAPNQS